MGLRNRFGRAALLAALALLLAAPGARALSVSDLRPLWFHGPGGFGFAPADVAAHGMPIAFSASPGSSFLGAGGRSGGVIPDPPLVVTSQRITSIHQNPQGAGRLPSVVDPYIVDSQWTLVNRSGRAFVGGYLLFTLGDGATPRQYPGLAIGLDGDLLSIVEYSAQGLDYRFGAVRLPELGVGGSFEFPVRYVVGGALDYDAERNAFVLPRLGLSAVLVPEPGTVVLLGLGLAGLAARGRRSARSS